MTRDDDFDWRIAVRGISEEQVAAIIEKAERERNEARAEVERLAQKLLDVDESERTEILALEGELAAERSRADALEGALREVTSNLQLHVKGRCDGADDLDTRALERARDALAKHGRRKT